MIKASLTTFYRSAASVFLPCSHVAFTYNANRRWYCRSLSLHSGRKQKNVRNRSLAIALYVNAAALIGGALYLAAGNVSLMPPAFAQQQAQPHVAAAIPATISMVPVQMSANTWGCYLLDADAQ